MPDDQTTRIMLLPDGGRVVIPIRADASASGQRVEIQGLIRCAYNNQAYDAVYQFDAAGAADPGRVHSYLAWEPRAPVLEESDVAAHRYVFRLPALAAGVSPTVRVDVDRFVNEFLIPPSEVRNSLSGQFSMTVDGAAIVAPASWPIALAAVPGLALIGGVAWVIRRRMAMGTLDFDLEAQLARVHEKSSAARRAVGIQDARLTPIRKRLKTLEDGAVKLACQIQQIRGARGLHSRFALERDIAALEQGGTPDALSEEVHLTLAGKKRALAFVTDLETTETLLSTRLNRVEAVIESTLAGLQTVKAGAMAAPVSDSLCRSLDSEVSALREAARPQPETILAGRVNRS